MAVQFLDRWRNEAPGIDARTVAVALQTAALSEKCHRDSQSVELVWTGPEIEGIPFRRTEQAIQQVLDSAKHRITLVSYAVYKIPRIREALVRAAHRGVRIKVIVETPNRIEGQAEYDTIQALGDQVAAVSSVYYWPEAQRARDKANKPGILHVKCAVADGRSLFLSSANLTEYAFTINMELGLLVAGGPLPCRVEEQFDRMIELGILEKEEQQSSSASVTTAEDRQPAYADELLDYCDERCKAFLQQWIEQGLPRPIVGFELQDDAGRVCADAELAWPDRKVAALLPERADAKGALEDRGWTVLDATQLAANDVQLRELIRG
jgi:phosphatidylserine/phosphatidylglycerophosphate/cardiolipin synthase-like enzyme